MKCNLQGGIVGIKYKSCRDGGNRDISRLSVEIVVNDGRQGTDNVGITGIEHSLKVFGRLQRREHIA